METLVGKYMNVSCGSDCSPFKIIKHPSEKTILIQGMRCIADKENSNLKFIVGGFAGHCVNQHEQKWNITESENGAIRCYTKRKDGSWYPKGTAMVYYNKCRVSDTPIKFYDYNY